jgi:hypothetical protein
LTGYRRGALGARLTLVPTNRDSSGADRPSAGREVVRLIAQIQALRLDLEALRGRGKGEPELLAKERSLEELRWRLAAAARQAANRDSWSTA